MFVVDWNFGCFESSIFPIFLATGEINVHPS